MVTCYPLLEIISEKIRSLAQRNRPRDIYDISYLSNIIEPENYSIIKQMILIKATDKKIEITGIGNFVNENKSNINKRAWKSSLGAHLSVGQLPDFDTTYSNIKQFIENILNS